MPNLYMRKGEKRMCNLEKKSIPTQYNGTTFRSKTEARFAVALDELKIEWQYEPEGFDLTNGLRYLPDFYIKKYDTWVEVKGVMEDYDEQKISGFEADYGYSVIVVDSSLKMNYFSRDEEVYLTEDGFTTEASDYAKEAFTKAAQYKFDSVAVEEKAVEQVPLTRLFDLKATQLNGFYKIDLSDDQPRIVNVVTDTHNNYLDTKWRIYIYASAREDFKIVLCDPDQKEVVSCSVKEIKTAEACRKIFRIAYELYTKNVNDYKHSTILSDGLNALAEWLNA